MKVYVICLVTKATPEALDLQSLYVRNLELDGHRVYYPVRDTNQRGTALEKVAEAAERLVRPCLCCDVGYEEAVCHL